MTGPVRGNIPPGRFAAPQQPKGRGGLLRFGLWPLLLAAGVFMVLPLLVLTLLMFVRGSDSPTPATPTDRVIVDYGPASTTPVQPCYPFQTDCVPR